MPTRTDLPFSPATARWFEDSFAAPTAVQRRGWERIAAGEHALLVAPTGSGKTLAAFLFALDRLAARAVGVEAGDEPTAEALKRPRGYRVVYVSPLKALVSDIERNLRAPLVGIRRAAEALGLEGPELRVDVRTGDTPQREREQQRRDPGDVLVTTPESLYLILGSRAGANLATTETLIVDEIHALAPTKRGVHLALSLERLAARVLAAGGTEPQRIGLSATARPLEDVARFLGGDRAVAIVDAGEPPRIELEIRVPVPDMERVLPDEARPLSSGAAQDGDDDLPSGSILGQLYHMPGNRQGNERGIWPAMYPQILEQIRTHRSTIVFVNNRALAERLAQRLNDLAGEELVLSHHGSVSHEKRAVVEDRLKRGEVRGIVATSSLELGIDMGAVDLVLLVESPGSVARGLQRIGRAGHQVGAASVGRLYPKFRGDLLECAVVVERMAKGQIESIHVPVNALDVLAQQVVAICCDGDLTVSALERLVKRAHPYRSLATAALTGVLDMLTGRFASTEFADLRPRLRWDRTTDVLGARRGTAMVARMNAGTIPDRGTFGVYLGEGGPRIGELDEEMVYESRDGDTFLLGTTTWRVEEITKDRVIVSPAPGEPGRLPFWKGDGPGRPLELGRAIGAFVREAGEQLGGKGGAPGGELDEAARDRLATWLRERLPLDEHAAHNLATYLAEQRAATGGPLPTDRAITIERFRDELGDWRVCILSPFGRRVHAPWAIAIEERLGRLADVEAQVMYTDDGIVLRLADGGGDGEFGGDAGLGALDLEALLPPPEEVVDLVTERVGRTAMFASLFRENAVRSLLVTRRRPDQRNPLWAQRLKTRALLATVQNLPDFPVVIETYRQALADEFDLTGLEDVLREVRARTIRVDRVETRSASPFARSLVFAYVAAYLYDGDSPIAERKAQALTLDKDLLRELLGQAELRELIDPGALAELEGELDGSADGWRARDRDELTDLLQRIGDRTALELAASVDEDECDDGGAKWLETLVEERRVIAITVGGEERFVAADGAGLFRDALGVNVPSGLPDAFVAQVPDALARLARRFAKGRGPFEARELAARYGLALERVEPVLVALERADVLVRGEMRPGGGGLEWCDTEILRRLKRKTLARLRREASAVDAAAFARFLPRWHGVRGQVVGRGGEAVDGAGGRGARDPGQLLREAVERLEGVALPWSVLATDALPARVPGFQLDALDLLAASGEIVWIGRGALGAKDGRVALVRRENVPLLVELEAAYEPPTPVHAALLERLGAGGACFLTELERAVRAEHDGLRTDDFEAVLWDLVWAGRITNDTFGPLRTLGARGARSAGGRSGRGGWRGVVAGGRWSRVDLLATGFDGDAVRTPTERALARANVLLARYGVVSREVARAEELAGGFATVYRTLRAIEESGRIRRGWFVEGLSGAQFAVPGAVDALRASDGRASGEHAIVVLAAVDPAQPFGALVPWPERAGAEGTSKASGLPRRVAGALVCLVDGEPQWWLSASRKQLIVFPSAEAATEREAGTRLERAFEALARLPRKGRRRLELETVDGVDATDGPHTERLVRCGFARDYLRLSVADPRL
ncbi:putative ATP-dependent helicase Lhr [Planctomycetes bacterium Pla163]|uniref:Putative ATP-dependent helicase Lhr n=1 Tax=Rohdeia mirabilis TaxID=2528008 RepID=A0A518CVK0_9BACT|nr:putative ATP-dependent helicase Lhr [Planctomycetes bacterium Pla163]